MRRYLFDDLVIEREQAQAIIEVSQESFVASGYGFWRIVLKEDDTSIGFCGLRRFNDEHIAGEQVELLYGLTATQWGKGIATEAAQAGLRYGFEQIRLTRIYAGTDPPNIASFRVMERLDMCFDHQAEIGGIDTRYYVITRDAYLSR